MAEALHAKRALSDFGGGVRLTSSSNGRGLFEPYGSLFHPYWRESEVQLAKKQAVLLMQDTLPQDVRSICALLQNQDGLTIGT